MGTPLCFGLFFYLHQVNGVNIEGMRHAEVVAFIKKGGDETWLLVVDPDTDEHFKKRRVVPTVGHVKGQTTRTRRHVWTLHVLKQSFAHLRFFVTLWTVSWKCMVCLCRLWWSVHIQRISQPSDQRQLHVTVHQIHALRPQQPGQQHSGEHGRLSSTLRGYSPTRVFISDHGASQAGRRRGRPAIGPLCWDWPESERYGSRGKEEDPCQREEEGSTDGLDEEIRALQQFLRRSPRQRTEIRALCSSRCQRTPNRTWQIVTTEYCTVDLTSYGTLDGSFSEMECRHVLLKEGARRNNFSSFLLYSHYHFLPTARDLIQNLFKVIFILKINKQLFKKCKIKKTVSREHGLQYKTVTWRQFRAPRSLWKGRLLPARKDVWEPLRETNNDPFNPCLYLCIHTKIITRFWHCIVCFVEIWQNVARHKSSSFIFNIIWCFIYKTLV